MGDVVTSDSLATASFPLDVEIPAYSPWVDSPMTYRPKKQKALKQASDAAAGLIRAHPADRGTDLMNAFQLAEKTFEADRNRGASQKILVVFSDMVEQTHRYDFASMKLTDAEAVKVIAAERKAGRLPDLKGVKVWVAGATAAPGAGLDADRIYRIQSFWLRYFPACGASLSRDHYSTTLLDFSVP